MISFEYIVSKIVAGGLGAGIFLFWWPEHVPGDGIEQLVLRGLLWTLTFELLLFAFAPFERLATARLQRRTAARRAAMRERLATAPTPAKTGGALALACMGLAAPLVLISGAPHELVKDAEPAREVVKQVVVEKPVVRREVIVKRVVVREPGATAVSSASVRTAEERPAATPAAATAKPAKKAAAKKTTTTAEKKPVAKVEQTAPESAAVTTPEVTPAAAKSATDAPATATATTTDAPTTDAPAATAPQQP